MRRFALLIVLPFALSACQVADKGDDLVNGKTAFVDKCGSCHTLNRAGTKGVTGPNLDQAFVRSLEDGMKRSTIRGVVRRQIEQPNRRPQLAPADPEDKPGAIMPANLVKGETAEDVSAYVASVAGRAGKDVGRLADVGVAQQAKGPATEKNGVLDIPIGPTGLVFQYAQATAQAGAVTINAKNPQSTQHNIAIEGAGLDQKGPVIANGATSTVKVTLKPGTYTFYCSVPGHREGGMVGKLTVK